LLTFPTGGVGRNVSGGSGGALGKRLSVKNEKIHPILSTNVTGKWLLVYIIIIIFFLLLLLLAGIAQSV
jgi:hypothetical protein